MALALPYWFCGALRGRFVPLKLNSGTVHQFFSGVTGTVYINDNGDRIADYALLDMDPEDGRFKVTLDDALLSLGRIHRGN